MKIKNILIISILILIFCIGIASASDNITQDDLSLDADQDELQVVEVSGSSFEDVQKAVDKSKRGDVIELEGYYSGPSKPITINKDLTIQGSSKGATLDAKKSDSVFVLKSNLVLKNLVIKNSGLSAIDDKSDTFKKLTVINCTFYNNGGEQCNNGAALFMSQGEFSFINCSFNKNRANLAVIYGNSFYGGSFEINNCNFTDNVADDSGAAIYMNGDITVRNCLFKNNKASSGGAIYSLGNLEVYNSKFINNHADYGGAINAGWSNLTVDNCLFDNNYANKDGGTIYSINPLYSDDIIWSAIKISNSKISNSKAGGNGGAIYTEFANLTLDKTSISCLSNCEDIFFQIGNFKNKGSTYKSIKKIDKLKAKLRADKLTTTYDSDICMAISLIEDGKWDLSDRSVKVRVYTGKSYKEYVLTIWDDDVSKACLWITKDFPVGKHKVVITSLSKYYDVKKITTYLIIKKAKTKVKAPAVKAKYKKSKLFKVTIKNKASNEKVRNVKIKIKVFTGKKYKIYKVKTNKKGVASINTKKLKRGSHKVKITSKNKNYSISKTSKIIIK